MKLVPHDGSPSVRHAGRLAIEDRPDDHHEEFRRGYMDEPPTGVEVPGVGAPPFPPLPPFEAACDSMTGLEGQLLGCSPVQLELGVQNLSSGDLATFKVGEDTTQADWASFDDPGELARRLAMGIKVGYLPDGLKDYLFNVKLTASTDAFAPRKSGLFPLPVNFHGAAQEALHLSPKEAAIACWLPLICHALNQLAGWKKPAPRDRRGAQVKRVLEHLRSRVERFLAPFCPQRLDPHLVWENVRNKQVSYEGEEYLDPVPLTVRQIEKTLPPLHHGGSVPVVDWVVGRCRHLITHPQEL